ncbi:MAG TPA: hypothetical protein PKC21_06705 [Oligoflexia bacterium]|nr:hypothetical protein [Oligoflexia bacterium]HMR25026.1 hypothetical protein [Oligoflexia bacterium]
MKYKKFKLSFLSMFLATTCVWAQTFNPRSVVEIDVEDVDVNFWSMLQDGLVYMKQDNNSLIRMNAHAKRTISEQVVMLKEGYRIDEVAYTRSSRIFLIEYLGSMSNEQLNGDLDNFLSTDIISDPERCPRPYTRMFVLPSELITSGEVSKSFPSMLVFDPISFKHGSRYGLIFNYSEFKMPLYSLLKGENQSNIVFVEYSCKQHTS